MRSYTGAIFLHPYEDEDNIRGTRLRDGDVIVPKPHICDLIDLIYLIVLIYLILLRQLFCCLRCFYQHSYASSGISP